MPPLCSSMHNASWPLSLLASSPCQVTCSLIFLLSFCSCHLLVLFVRHFLLLSLLARVYLAVSLDLSLDFQVSLVFFPRCRHPTSVSIQLFGTHIWYPYPYHIVEHSYCESQCLTVADADESTKTGAEDITTEEQEAENAEAADKTRIWIIGHLCSVAQAQTCNKATAVEILQFLCTVAFVNNGPKGPKSKLAPVKLLADSEFDISEEVRNCAVARAASLATEGLPCTAITVSKDKIDEEKQDDDDVNKGKGGEKNAAGKKKGKGDMKQRHSNLLIEVSKDCLCSLKFEFYLRLALSCYHCLEF